MSGYSKTVEVAASCHPHALDKITVLGFWDCGL